MKDIRKTVSASGRLFLALLLFGINLFHPLFHHSHAASEETAYAVEKPCTSISASAGKTDAAFHVFCGECPVCAGMQTFFADPGEPGADFPRIPENSIFKNGKQCILPVLARAGPPRAPPEDSGRSLL